MFVGATHAEVVAVGCPKPGWLPMAVALKSSPEVEALFDAAFDFGRWPTALQKLADTLGVTSCVIRSGDPSHPFRSDQRGATSHRPDSTEHAEFAALWMERIDGAPDPYEERARRLAKPAPSFTVEDEISTAEERRLLPYYQEIARPGNREWRASLSFRVLCNPWCFPMFRDARRGRFERSEADRFLRLSPDLGRAISIAEKVWASAADATLGMLDRFSCAAMVLDCHGHVTRHNEHAEALLGPDLSIRHRRLHAADRGSDARLNALIGQTPWERSGRAEKLGPVVIERDGLPWLAAEVIPMTSFMHDLFNGGDVLLHFTDVSSDPAPSRQLLQRLFRLTPAEARLAARLADGSGIDGASAALQVGRETVRTQLRAIFAKTGAHRQAELVALLSRCIRQHRP
jgi:DNA-binding CsgD family transcriptional regulator